MRRSWFRLLTMSLAAGLVATAVVGSVGAGPRPAPIPLNISFAGSFVTDETHPDPCASIDSLNPLRIRSDGGGEYQNGFENVSATLDPASNALGDGVNFQTNPMRTSRRGPRRVMLGFCGIVDESVKDDPLVNGVVAADVYAYLWKEQSGDQDLRSMTFGQTTTRRFYLQWPRTNAAYRLRWYSADGYGSGLDVTCQADTGGTNPSCTQWELTPSGPAMLEKWATTGNYSVVGLYGPYDMPFKVTIAVQ